MNERIEIDCDTLRAMIARWRQPSANEGEYGNGVDAGYNSCADEVEELLRSAWGTREYILAQASTETGCKRG